MHYLLLIYEDEKALHARDEKTRNQVFQEYGAHPNGAFRDHRGSSDLELRVT